MMAKRGIQDETRTGEIIGVHRQRSWAKREAYRSELMHWFESLHSTKPGLCHLLLKLLNVLPANVRVRRTGKHSFEHC